MMKTGRLILDCQYGSTGKGLIAGYLAEKNGPDTLITAWAPNAGHTYIDGNGRKFVHTMLANGIVSKNFKRLMVGPGSVINVANLLAEIEACKDLVSLDQVYIHPHAAVVFQSHRDQEVQTMTAIGSTSKGTGAAMMQRILRDPKSMNVAKQALLDTPLEGRVVTVDQWMEILQYGAEHVQIEGAQGFSLSIYHGQYPYTTSRDVTTAQVLADCGIPRGMGIYMEVVGTCRTFPIRVANRYDVHGRQVGFSGPHYEDQTETTFAEIGQEQELTTVTQLPRRIFTYSRKQIEQAVLMNGVDTMFLNFANYATEEQLDQIAGHIRSLTQLGWLGWGPTAYDVHNANTAGAWRK